MMFDHSTSNKISREIIRGTKSHQDTQDACDIAVSLDKFRRSLSIIDVINSDRVPLLQGSILNTPNTSKANTSARMTIKSSIPVTTTVSNLYISAFGNESLILKYIDSIARPLNIGRINSSEVHIKLQTTSKQTLSKKSQLSSEERSSTSSSSSTSTSSSSDQILVKAMDCIEGAREILDPSRLHIEAAFLFYSLGMVDRAIKYFEKSTINKVSSDIIVDHYDLPETNVYKRKIERMSKFQLNDFLKRRHELRESLIGHENERRRLRSLMAYCQLLRLYLSLQYNNIEPEAEGGEEGNAHRCLCEAFRCCRTASEHEEVLRFSHRIIKEFALSKRKRENSLSEQIIRSSAGPLADSHIYILHELLEKNEKDIDVLEWLGYRYAEKCDFESSWKYLNRYRDLKAEKSRPEELREKYLFRPNGMDDTELLKAISKKEVLGFGQDVQDVINDHDRRQRERKDFACFGGVHQASHTFIYDTPAQGWKAGAEGQLRRLELLNQSFSLPQCN